MFARRVLKMIIFSVILQKINVRLREVISLRISIQPVEETGKASGHQEAITG